MTANQIIAVCMMIALILIVIRVMFFCGKGHRYRGIMSVLAMLIAGSCGFWFFDLLRASKYHVTLSQLGLLVAVCALLWLCDGNVSRAFDKKRLNDCIHGKMAGRANGKDSTRHT